MARLIERLRFSDFARPEPNPFRFLDQMRRSEEEEAALFGSDDGKGAGDGEDDDDDDDEDEDEEEDGNRGGWIDYLSSCSIM